MAHFLKNQSKERRQVWRGENKYQNNSQSVLPKKLR